MLLAAWLPRAGLLTRRQQQQQQQPRRQVIVCRYDTRKSANNAEERKKQRVKPLHARMLDPQLLQQAQSSMGTPALAAGCAVDLLHRPGACTPPSAMLLDHPRTHSSIAEQQPPLTPACFVTAAANKQTQRTSAPRPSVVPPVVSCPCSCACSSSQSSRSCWASALACWPAA